MWRHGVSGGLSRTGSVHEDARLRRVSGPSLGAAAEEGIAVVGRSHLRRVAFLIGWRPTRRCLYPSP